MKWISIEDKEPEKTTPFLVFLNNNTIHSASYDEELKRFIVGGFGPCCTCGGSCWLEPKEKAELYEFYITHWMELPDSPNRT